MVIVTTDDHHRWWFLPVYKYILLDGWVAISVTGTEWLDENGPRSSPFSPINEGPCDRFSHTSNKCVIVQTFSDHAFWLLCMNLNKLYQIKFFSLPSPFVIFLSLLYWKFYIFFCHFFIFTGIKFYIFLNMSQEF